MNTYNQNYPETLSTIAGSGSHISKEGVNVLKTVINEHLTY